MPKSKTPGKRVSADANQDKFVKELIRQAEMGEVKVNLAEAYRNAGYSPNGARQSAQKLLSHASVQGKLADRIGKAQMDSDEILEGLTQIARGKKASKVVIEDGEALGKDGEPFTVRKKRSEFDRKGGYEAMARVRGLLTEGVPATQVTVNVGAILPQVPIQVLEQLAALMKAKSQAIEIEARPV